MRKINTAVVKSLLLKLTEEEFILVARFFRKKANSSAPGSKDRQYFIKLFLWCHSNFHLVKNKK